MILPRILLDFGNQIYRILVLFKEKVAPTAVLDDRESRMAGNRLEAPTRVLDERFWLSGGFRFKCGSFFITSSSILSWPEFTAIEMVSFQFHFPKM